jgi:hypothetical protein
MIPQSCSYSGKEGKAAIYYVIIAEMKTALLMMNMLSIT